MTWKQGTILAHSAGRRMILKWIIMKYSMTGWARFLGEKYESLAGYYKYDREFSGSVYKMCNSLTTVIIYQVL